MPQTLGNDARKHYFVVCKLQWHRPAFASVQSDQPLFDSISRKFIGYMYT